MKIFSKKSEVESLHALNEKEIQKRLYGRYHREAMPAGEKPSTNNAARAVPELEIPDISRSFSFSNRLKAFPARFQNAFLSFWQKFPWKFSGFLIGFLVAFVILFQVFSSWFGKVKAVPPASGLNAVNEPAPLALPVKKVEVSLPRPTIQAQAPRKSYYAVQICTYQREGDARQLTRVLESLNFPAFYLHNLSAQERITFYTVFLGKEETYAAAKARLNEFRKTEASQKFPDSFIRSLKE